MIKSRALLFKRAVFTELLEHSFQDKPAPILEGVIANGCNRRLSVTRVSLMRATLAAGSTAISTEDEALDQSLR
jgi:hypothetical protein